MLLHEWLQYRDKRIRRLRSQMDDQDEQTAAEQAAETEGQAPEAYAPPAEPPAEAEAAPAEVTPAEATPAEAAETPELPEPSAESSATAAADQVEAVSAEPARPADEAATAPRRRRAKRKSPAQAPQSAREVLETLQPSQDLRARLEAVLARQKRLPLEEVEDETKRPKKRRVVETREQLVERLLDPTLTLQEAALLLGVCPTTVRRYTNRGILRCFRTPGNQRRFKLSDILEFMERRETEAAGQEDEDE